MKLIACLLGPCVLLVSCGGGGSDGGAVDVIGGPVSSVPTPTASPTANAGTLRTGEIKPAAGATFLASSFDLLITGGSSVTSGIITGGATTNRITTFSTPQFSGSYDSSSGYRLSDAFNSAVFGPAQLQGDSTQVNGNGLVFFASPSANASDYLAVYQGAAYTSSVRGAGYTSPIYGGYAGWQHSSAEGGAQRTRLDYFVYGTPTPPSAMPRSGVIKLTVFASGNYARDSDLWYTSTADRAAITVDFATGTISGIIGLAGQNFFKSEVGGIGSLPITGSISGNSVVGKITNGSLRERSGIPGEFRMLFVGPNASEAIITYVANDGREAAVGAAVASLEIYAG